MSSMDTTTPNGRDTRGRFAPGNPGGPGNPFTRQTALLRSIVLEEINETELRLIVQRLKALALSGDLQAIKLLLAYAAGKPEAAVNPDDVDRLEWEQRQRQTVSPEAVEALTERVPARQANAIAEATRPAVALQHGQDLYRRLLERGLLPPAPATPAKRPEVRPAYGADSGARR